MPERIARVATEYKERRIAVGETFHVEQPDVVILLAVGHIEPEEGEPGYERDMTAGGSPTYLTRDMQSRRGRPRKVSAQ